MSFLSTNLFCSSNFLFSEQESVSEILFSLYFQKDEHFEFYEKISCYDDDSNKEIFSQETNATEPKLKCISEKNINLEEKAKYCFCSTNEN